MKQSALTHLRSPVRMLANFPRAYSHVALINCALNLAPETGPLHERAEAEARPPVAASAALVTAGHRNDQTRSLITEFQSLIDPFKGIILRSPRLALRDALAAERGSPSGESD